VGVMVGVGPVAVLSGGFGIAVGEGGIETCGSGTAVGVETCGSVVGVCAPCVGVLFSAVFFGPSFMHAQKHSTIIINKTAFVFFIGYILSFHSAGLQWLSIRINKLKIW
ncbi:MAG: hypothetical protein ACI4QX_04435, partial [Lachnospiraceae bacterium]